MVPDQENREGVQLQVLFDQLEIPELTALNMLTHYRDYVTVYFPILLHITRQIKRFVSEKLTVCKCNIRYEIIGSTPCY